ncbi:MAG: TSUP family transporter [Firmicutes bacterium]|nr:TSUP family transporter [Bacillota bacterium]
MTCLLFAAAAFVSAALSGMGLGGGGLFIIYLTFASDIPQSEAQLCNLIFFIAASSASLPLHIMYRRLNFAVIAALSIGGAVGALIGTSLSLNFSGGLIRYIMGAFFAASGIFSLVRSFRGGS